MITEWRKTLNLLEDKWLLIRSWLLQLVVVVLDLTLVLLISVPLGAISTKEVGRSLATGDGTPSFHTVILLLIICIPALRIYVLNVSLRTIQEIGGTISRKLFSVYIDKGVGYSVEDESSLMSKLFTMEINRFTNNVYTPLLKISVNIIFTVLLFLIMLYTSWILTLLIFFLSFAMFLLSEKIINSRVKRNARIIDSSLQGIYRIISDVVLGKFEIGVYGLGNRFKSRYIENSRALHNRTAQSQTLSEAIRPMLEGLLIPTVFGFLIFVDTLSLNKLGVFMYAALKLLGSAQIIFSSRTLLKTNVYALDNLSKFSDRLKRIKAKDIYSGARISSISIRSFTVFREVKHVCRFESLDFVSGDIVALVGPSGSGKTSFIGALMGFHKYDGALNINGVLCSQAIYPRVSYVAQTPMIWNVSAYDFISGTDSPAQVEEIEEVVGLIQAVGLHKRFVTRDSIENELCGENGNKLSGGEKMRLALARALYRNAEVIIYDEVTSSLDEQTAKDILKLIKRISKDRITLMITHRQQDLEITNKIVSF